MPVCHRRRAVRRGSLSDYVIDYDTDTRQRNNRMSWTMTPVITSALPRYPHPRPGTWGATDTGLRPTNSGPDQHRSNVPPMASDVRKYPLVDPCAGVSHSSQPHPSSEFLPGDLVRATAAGNPARADNSATKRLISCRGCCAQDQPSIGQQVSQAQDSNRSIIQSANHPCIGFAWCNCQDRTVTSKAATMNSRQTIWSSSKRVKPSTLSKIAETAHKLRTTANKPVPNISSRPAIAGGEARVAMVAAL